MKQELAQYKQYKEELSAELRKYVQDKNNPLDERFEALCECPELSYSSDIVFFGIQRIKDSYYYDCFRRGTKKFVKDIFEGFTTDLLSERDKLTPEEEITFKEYCCDNFISSMIFDW